MTPGSVEQKLSDLVAFQCVLVGLRGVGAAASEEMVWQALLTMLVEQFGFERAWYEQCKGNGVRAVISAPMHALAFADPPAEAEETNPIPGHADLMLPVSVEGRAEGKLSIDAGGGLASDQSEHIGVLVSEAVTMLAERRSRLRAEEALQHAMREAESANRAKSLLLANMSHEIRTPMTGVLGFTDLLATTELNSEQRDYVETIRSCGKALLNLINDILDFSKIESGKLELASLPVDVRTLVEQVVGLLTVQASAKGLRLFSQVDSTTPWTILADGLRLRQVLVNLVGNAIKFTNAGEVSLAVFAGAAEEGRHRISFVVNDTGPGIAPEHHQTIFDSFSQVDNSNSRKHGGTGLGLAISSSLAAQMGGSLRVDSELGRGAAFTFEIPAQAADQSLARNGKAGSFQAAGLPDLRVIVVDDNPFNLKLALAMLKRVGLRADSADNAKDLLDRLTREAYDLVLIDVQMPEMDGLTATRHIRRQWPPERQPHIIAMTAGAFPEDRGRCLEAGMNDYISKPIDFNEAVDALRRIPPRQLSRSAHASTPMGR